MRALTACIAVLLLVSMASAQKISRTDRAKIRETRETLKSLQADLAAIHASQNAYPETLNAIIESKMREALPKDAWGRDFKYELSAEHGFKLVSFGADGKAGGEGAGVDITWTRAGELREMTADERTAWLARLDELRFQASRVIARKRMAVVAGEVVNHRREKGEFPANLANCKRAGSQDAAVAINACFTDPWGRDFALKLLPKGNFAVVCWGADGKEDGLGRDADFVVTEREVRAAYAIEIPDWWGWGWGGTSNVDWQVQDLAQDVLRYRRRHGKLPEELADLTRAPAGAGPVQQPIRSSIPSDSWGNDYVYVKLGEKEFYVVGLGEDGLEGGVKDNKDLIHPVPGTVPEEPYVEEEPEAMPEALDNEVLAKTAKLQMEEIIKACNQYALEHDQEYPESLDDIKDLFVGEVVPKDPWGAAFIYELVVGDDDTTTFTLTCLGSDSAEGGEGHAADIVLNEASEQQ